MTHGGGAIWHESYVVWKVPPKACVHVTHGTWHMTHKVTHDTWWMDHVKTHGHEREKRKREETSSSQAKKNSVEEG